MKDFWRRSFWFGLLLSASGELLAQVYPDPERPPDTEPGQVLDLPEERLVDTADAELPATPREPVDTSAGFFAKILRPGYPNPERAAAMSFVLPGSGQIYNRRFAWLKVPVIAAGYGLFIYSGEFNRDLKNRLEDAYEFRLNENNAQVPTEFDEGRRSFLTADQLRIQRDRVSKNYQLSYIGLVVFHLVQTLEAYTTAHLLEFDMDESLTLRPSVGQAPGLAGLGASPSPTPALTLTWRPQVRRGR